MTCRSHTADRLARPREQMQHARAVLSHEISTNTPAPLQPTPGRPNPFDQRYLHRKLLHAHMLAQPSGHIEPSRRDVARATTRPHISAIRIRRNLRFHRYKHLLCEVASRLSVAAIQIWFCPMDSASCPSCTQASPRWARAGLASQGVRPMTCLC